MFGRSGRVLHLWIVMLLLWMHTLRLSFSIALIAGRGDLIQEIVILDEVLAVLQIDERIRNYSSFDARSQITLIHVDHLLAIQFDRRHDHLKLLRP